MSVEASQRHWEDDGCLDERRAILVLQQGRLALRRKQWAEAQRQFEETEKGLPPESEDFVTLVGSGVV